MSAIKDLMTLCCREQWQNGLFRHVACEGDALVLPPPHHAGAFCLPPVDSGEKGFAWSRLIVDAVLPQDCGLRIYTRCADAPDWAAWEALQAAFDAPGEDDPLPLLRRCYGAPEPPGTDCWLSGAGRYLWVAFELTVGVAVFRIFKRVLVFFGHNSVPPFVFWGENEKAHPRHKIRGEHKPTVPPCLQARFRAYRSGVRNEDDTPRHTALFRRGARESVPLSPRLRTLSAASSALCQTLVRYLRDFRHRFCL